MSLCPTAIDPVPKQTDAVAQLAFPNGNLYMQMRDELGTFFADKDFTALYPKRGRPAFAPWRLSLVTVMQFMENLSDRQAAEAVRARIDWKYALGLELADPGFDFSIFSEFRGRLVWDDGKRAWDGKEQVTSRRRAVSSSCWTGCSRCSGTRRCSRRGGGSAPTAPTSWPPSAS